MDTAVDDQARPPTEAEVERALARFLEAAQRHYGDRLKGLYLFGSRARGDFRPDSDADVAVVLEDGDWTPWVERWALHRLAYEPSLNSGLFIQPWVFSASQWDDNNAQEPANLLRSVKRDAVRLGEAA
jgi:uncharacterized protein